MSNAIQLRYFKGSDGSNESHEKEPDIHNMNAKLKWNYVVEKVKEEKYIIGQKCSYCSNQLHEKSQTMGATVKMQANAVLAESANKAKEAEVIIKEKSNKIKEKSQLAGESIKETSNVVGETIKSKSLNAGEAVKLHTMNAGTNVKAKSLQASEMIRGKIEAVKVNTKISEPTDRNSSNLNDENKNKVSEGKSNHLKEDDDQENINIEPYKEIPTKVNISSQLLQKSQEILRKQTKKAGRAFALIFKQYLFLSIV